MEKDIVFSHEESDDGGNASPNTVKQNQATKPNEESYSLFKTEKDYFFLLSSVFEIISYFLFVLMFSGNVALNVWLIAVPYILGFALRTDAIPDFNVMGLSVKGDNPRDPNSLSRKHNKALNFCGCPVYIYDLPCFVKYASKLYLMVRYTLRLQSLCVDLGSVGALQKLYIGDINVLTRSTGTFEIDLGVMMIYIMCVCLLTNIKLEGISKTLKELLNAWVRDDRDSLIHMLATSSFFLYLRYSTRDDMVFFGSILRNYVIFYFALTSGRNIACHFCQFYSMSSTQTSSSWHNSYRSFLTCYSVSCVILYLESTVEYDFASYSSLLCYMAITIAMIINVVWNIITYLLVSKRNDEIEDIDGIDTKRVAWNGKAFRTDLLTFDSTRAFNMNLVFLVVRSVINLCISVFLLVVIQYCPTSVLVFVLFLLNVLLQIWGSVNGLIVLKPEFIFKCRPASLIALIKVIVTTVTGFYLYRSISGTFNDIPTANPLVTIFDGNSSTYVGISQNSSHSLIICACLSIYLFLELKAPIFTFERDDWAGDNDSKEGTALRWVQPIFSSFDKAFLLTFRLIYVNDDFLFWHYCFSFLPYMYIAYCLCAAYFSVPRSNSKGDPISMGYYKPVFITASCTVSLVIAAALQKAFKSSFVVLNVYAGILLFHFAFSLLGSIYNLKSKIRHILAYGPSQSADKRV